MAEQFASVTVASSGIGLSLGIEALLADKDHVYAASGKTKVEGMLAYVIPGKCEGRHAR